jgi:hypothetical protein
MRTRVLILGIAFVLLTAIPVQADLPVSDDAKHRQLPTKLQQRHLSATRAVGDLIIHASTLPPTAQDRTPAARRLPSQPRWMDEFAHRR